MTRVERFLASVPQLSRLPDDWEDQHFYLMEIDRGTLCVLAYDLDEAERATVIYFGRVAQPSPVRDDNGEPVTMPVPELPMAGAAQYLDATRVLHGDPCDSPMRAPDSSPALGLGSAFILDTCGGTSHPSIRSFGPLVRAAERDERARDEYLARAEIGRRRRESM